MLCNYLKIAYRNLRHYRTTTLMNVLSLAVGITCCLVVYVIVRHEYTYDNFQPQADRMYRLVTETQTPEGPSYHGAASLAMAEALRDDVAAVAEATQVVRGGGILKYTDVAGRETRWEVNHGAWVDTHYFRVFDHPALVGNPKTWLQRPDEVVVTRALADRLLGPEAAERYETLVGREVRVEGISFSIGGVLEDIPDRTNIYFEMLLPLEVRQRQRPDWSASWEPLPKASNAFFVLKDGHTPAEVAAAINQRQKLHLNDDLAQRRTYHAQALADIHTEVRYGGTFFPLPTLLLAALAGLGLIVLLTGSINFVNLSTAQAVQRAREIGIRKVLGGQRRQLMGQLLGEAGGQVMAATLLAVGLAELFLDGVNQYMATFSRWVVMRFSLDVEVAPFLVGLTVIVTLLAGLYPAWITTRFQPVAVLKSSGAAVVRTKEGTRFSLRKVLVVTQFVVVHLLLIGTLVVATQMQYFRESDAAGFAQENTLLINVPNPARSEALRQQLQQQAGVQRFSFADSPPTSRRRNTYEVYTNENSTQHSFSKRAIDDQYVATYELSLAAGRNLRPADRVADTARHQRVLVNERAVRTLGWDPAHALGKTIFVGDSVPQQLEIVGVLADFSNNTLKEEVAAEYYYFGNSLTRVHVRFAGNPAELLPTLRAAWEPLFPEHVFRYEFLDDYLATLYTIEDMFYRMFRIMAGLALLIGVVGLYGLVSYVTLHRQKEVGIRKVLGATARHILSRFTHEFLGLVLLAFGVAAPLAYFALHAWLNTFAHRIDLHPGFFVLTLLLTLAVAGLTVGYRVLRAAWANPVDSLRNE